MAARKLTKEVEWAIRDAIAKGGSQREAAKAANVAYGTLTRWLKEGRDQRRAGTKGKCYRLLVAVEEARAECIDALDKVEWTIAMDANASPGARLRACELIRNRVVYQGRPRPVVVEVTGEVQHDHDHHHEGTVEHEVREAETPRDVLTDAQVRNLTGEELERLATALATIGADADGNVAES